MVGAVITIRAVIYGWGSYDPISCKTTISPIIKMFCISAIALLNLILILAFPLQIIRPDRNSFIHLFIADNKVHIKI